MPEWSGSFGGLHYEWTSKEDPPPPPAFVDLVEVRFALPREVLEDLNAVLGRKYGRTKTIGTLLALAIRETVRTQRRTE